MSDAAGSPRVGLVLGAGGVVGQAYHAGVLAALEHDLGWDPRTADVIVGTSAGSIVGTLLRLGVGASDLARFAVESPLSIEASAILEPIAGDEMELPPFTARDLIRRWAVPSAAMVGRIARRPWAWRPATTIAALAPPGRIDITDRVDALHRHAGDDLPENLWICAVRRTDGARVVFGRPGSPRAPFGLAVAASCAIPGYFAPVTIGGVEYVDGGAHSSTNADVLRHDPPEVVIVVVPMSSARGRVRSADGLMRRVAHRQARAEVQRLRRLGVSVLTIEPGRHSLAAMGVNMMATDRADAVVQAAFIETGRRTARPHVAERLAVLGEQARERHQRGSA